MKKNNLIIVAVLLVSMSIVSCKKDKEDPKIIVNSPANHSEFVWGETISASATFTDDRELASYHIHVADESGSHTEDWEYHKSGDIDGASYDWSDNLVVPDSVPSVLYLHFEVTDAEGKTGESMIMMHLSE